MCNLNSCQVSTMSVQSNIVHLELSSQQSEFDFAYFMFHVQSSIHCMEIWNSDDGSGSVLPLFE